MIRLRLPSAVTRRRTALVGIAVTSPLLWHAPTAHAAAQGIINVFNPLQWVASILIFFLWIISVVIGLFLSFFGHLLDYILAVSRFSTNEWVIAGWTFTRDALNFLFIAALLIIAFGTIAGFETYGMKNLLPRLIFMALLVNFSLAIGGAFVDFSRILMVGLIGGNGQQQGSELSQRLAQAAAVERYLTLQPDQLVPPQLVERGGIRRWVDTLVVLPVARVVGAFAATFMLFVVMLAIGATALLMLVRVVLLYMLLMLAPVGFVLSILPKTAEYARMWWDAFLRYVIFGPVVVFFLVIATRIAAIGRGGPGRTLTDQLFLPGTAPEGIIRTVFMEGVFGALFSTLLQSFFVVAFIVVGLLVAKQLGVIGAGVATSAAGLITAAPGRAGGYGARVAGRVAGAAGMAAARGAGTGLGKIPYAGAALRAARAPGVGKYALGAGTVQEQLEAQQKSVKGLNTAGLKAAMARGNAGAAAELLERKDLDTEEEFQRAMSLAPRGSKFEENLGQAYGTKFAVSAANRGVPELAHKTLENRLARGGPGIPSRFLQKMVDSGEKIKAIRKGLGKMEEKDIKKNAAQVRAAIKAATLQIQQGERDTENLAVDLTSSKLIAYSRNLGPEGQTELGELIQEMARNNMLGKAQEAAAKKDRYL